MTNISSDIDLLRIDENSKTDSGKIKRNRILKTPVSTDIPSVKSNDSINSIVRSYNKSKTVSKKKPFTRYLYPTNQSQSQLFTRPINNYDQETYHYHQQQTPSTDNCDMRFFIIRHGERVDRYFGSSWFLLAFNQLGQYHPYHINLPPTLPTRSNKYYWALDTPLTRDGLNAALNVGQVLGINHFDPTYVYSSPAMRCVLTTYQILKGLGLENKIPIRIEPGLLELGAARFGMSIFLTPIDWHHYGINVDLSYQPIMSDMPTIERENEYYLRSKYVIRQIEQNHNKNSSYSSLLNILIVAHATSPDTLTWDLVRRQPNIYDLYTLSLNIGYLQMVITERQRQNKLWSLTQMPLQSTTLKWV